jgi:hypothetical protein
MQYTFTFKIFWFNMPPITTHEPSIADWILVPALIVTAVLFVIYLIIYGILFGWDSIFIIKLGEDVNNQGAGANNQRKDAKDKLSFTSWSGALTTAGTVLSIIVALQANNPFTSLSLITAIVIIAVPLVYNALAPRRAFVWFFLLMTTLTLGAVLAELAAAFLLVGNITNISPWELITIQLLILITFIMAVWYDVSTTNQIFLDDLYLSQELNKRLNMATSGSPADFLLRFTARRG